MFFHLITLTFTGSCVASVCFKVNIFVHKDVKVKNKLTDTKENTSWRNNVIINMLDSVPNYEECQTFCQVLSLLMEALDLGFKLNKYLFKDESQCTAWTWTNNINPDFKVWSFCDYHNFLLILGNMHIILFNWTKNKF